MILLHDYILQDFHITSCLFVGRKNGVLFNLDSSSEAAKMYNFQCSFREFWKCLLFIWQTMRFKPSLGAFYLNVHWLLSVLALTICIELSPARTAPSIYITLRQSFVHSHLITGWCSDMCKYMFSSQCHNRSANTNRKTNSHETWIMK